MSASMQAVVRALAKEVTKIAQSSGENCYDCYEGVERVLRERLLPLLEAGQALRKGGWVLDRKDCEAWDSAVEALTKGGQ